MKPALLQQGMQHVVDEHGARRQAQMIGEKKRRVGPVDWGF